MDEPFTLDFGNRSWSGRSSDGTASVGNVRTLPVTATPFCRPNGPCPPVPEARLAAMPQMADACLNIRARAFSVVLHQWSKRPAVMAIAKGRSRVGDRHKRTSGTDPTTTYEGFA